MCLVIQWPTVMVLSTQQIVRFAIVMPPLSLTYKPILAIALFQNQSSTKELASLVEPFPSIVPDKSIVHLVPNVNVVKHSFLIKIKTIVSAHWPTQSSM